MTHTKIALCSLAAMFVAGQAFAHTGVRDQTTEGTSSYNGFTITHGCGGDGGQAYPVIGQSVAFPFGATAVWRTASGAVIPPTTKTRGLNGNKAVDENQFMPDGVTPNPNYNPTVTVTVNTGGGVIAVSNIGTVDGLNLGATGYASASSAFVTSQEIVDAEGVVRGMLWKDGAMAPNLNTVTPFKVSLPKLVNDCTRLRIRNAVINYCDTNKNEANDAMGPYKAPNDAYGRAIPFVTISDLGNPGYTDGLQKNVNGSPVYRDMRAGNDDNNRADWWFNAAATGSTKYVDPDLGVSDAEWSASIIVNSDTAGSNCPLDATGKPIITEYIVEPSGADIDSILSGPNTRPFSRGDSAL